MSINFNFCGTNVTVNNLDLLQALMKAQEKSRADAEATHQHLMSKGVVAYRINDGWVDRENHHVTFFDHENTKGFYWSNALNLSVGDLICLISDDKFQYAQLVERVSCGRFCTTFKFKITKGETR